MAKHLTFRQLLKRMTDLAKQMADAGTESVLDQPVTARLHTEDDCFAGGIFDVDIDAGCTETDALVIDADQDPKGDEPIKS